MLARRRDKGGPERLAGPPVKLKAPSARLRRILTLAWLACAAFAIVAQAGTTWRVYVFQFVTNPAFASVGLAVIGPEAQDWRISARSAAAAGRGIGSRETIERIGGAPLERSDGAERAAGRIAGADGQPVTIVLAPRTTKAGEHLPRREIRMVRSEAERERVFAAQDRAFRIASQIVDLLIAMVLVLVAARLKWGRPKDPVAILLSFALLFLATLGCWRFWTWLRVEWISVYLNVVWLSLLLVALPALPNGRYVPPWSRWFMLLGPATALLLILDRDHSPQLDSLPEVLVMAASALAVLLSVVLRFTHTGRGRERQQMKWASLGFGLGVPLAYFGGTIAGLLPSELAFAERYLEFVLTRIGYVLMPIGLLRSMLEYRLNDADGAIGRSLAYVAVTTLVGVLWALGTHYSNRIIYALTGADNQGLAIALSSAAALAIFTPARTLALGWAEELFQGALLRLRSLPDRIERWRHDDDAKRVAGRALTAIIECVDARYGALVSGDDEIVATRGTTDEAVLASLAQPKARKRPASPFPLRVQSRNQAGGPLTLLIGPRSDDATYSRQERSAVAAIAEPLADALYAVSRRAERQAALAGALAEIGARLDRLGPVKPRPRPRKPVAKLLRER